MFVENGNSLILIKDLGTVFLFSFTTFISDVGW